MAMDLPTLASGIRKCTACGFADPTHAPIPPDAVRAPARVMFVGEWPAWVEGQDTPLAETTPAGKALRKHYLIPLGIDRAQAWVTNLVKCRCPRAFLGERAAREAEIQRAVAQCSAAWLPRELEVARPAVLVTLADAEVYARMRQSCGLSTPERFEDAVGKAFPVTLWGHAMVLFPMVHPESARPLGEGDSRRREERLRWADRHHNEHIPALRRWLASNPARPA